MQLSDTGDDSVNNMNKENLRKINTRTKVPPQNSRKLEQSRSNVIFFFFLIRTKQAILLQLDATSQYLAPSKLDSFETENNQQ